MSRHNLNYITGISLEHTERMTKTRNAYLALESQLEQLLPGSRESSVAWTNLEQSLMWAIKSLCVDSQQAVSEFDFAEPLP